MAQVNIKIEDNLKEQAEKLLNELGMNMSTAFNVFIKQLVREGGIPFGITTQVSPFYKELYKDLAESENDIAAGRVYTLEEMYDRIDNNWGRK
jgi:DNA-damage-inducible protein J